MHELVPVSANCDCPHPMHYLDAAMCCIVAIAVDASFPGTFSVASELWALPPVTFPKELQ